MTHREFSYLSSTFVNEFCAFTCLVPSFPCLRISTIAEHVIFLLVTYLSYWGSGLLSINVNLHGCPDMLMWSFWRWKQFKTPSFLVNRSYITAPSRLLSLLGWSSCWHPSLYPICMRWTTCNCLLINGQGKKGIYFTSGLWVEYILIISLCFISWRFRFWSNCVHWRQVWWKTSIVDHWKHMNPQISHLPKSV